MTISIACPDCAVRFRAPDDYAGRTVRCTQCGTQFSVPAASPAPPPNPYRSPSVIPEAVPEARGEPQGRPIPLVILTVLAGVHVLLQAAALCIGVVTENPGAFFGGAISVGFYVAILIGLIYLQEWARILVIWLSYVNLVTSLFVFLFLVPVEIVTLVFAHWPSVREATRGASMAKTYTYHEPQHQEG